MLMQRLTEETGAPSSRAAWVMLPSRATRSNVISMLVAGILGLLLSVMYKSVNRISLVWQLSPAPHSKESNATERRSTQSEAGGIHAGHTTAKKGRISRI